MGASLNLDQRSYLSCAVVNAETHNRSKCQEQLTVECSDLNKTISTVKLRKHHRRKGGKNVRDRRWTEVLGNAALNTARPLYL